MNGPVEEPANRFGMTIGPVPTDPESAILFNKRVNAIADAVQNHAQHHFTCHKGSVGQYKCRLCIQNGPDINTRIIAGKIKNYLYL